MTSKRAKAVSFINHHVAHIQPANRTEESAMRGPVALFFNPWARRDGDVKLNRLGVGRQIAR